MEPWRTYIETYTPVEGPADERAALHVCQLALAAATHGTYGIGAALFDEAGEVVAEGHNEVFIGGFRSDLHAEMVVLNRFEDAPAGRGPESLTLVSSLEPCPMCMARAILAGVGTVLYVGNDDAGGMVRMKASLPTIFQEISNRLGQVWRPADCSPGLRDAAFQIWEASSVAHDPLTLHRPRRRGWGLG